jgi:hypothetical protein
MIGSVASLALHSPFTKGSHCQRDLNKHGPGVDPRCTDNAVQVVSLIELRTTRLPRECPQSASTSRRLTPAPTDAVPGCHQPRLTTCTNYILLKYDITYVVSLRQWQRGRSPIWHPCTRNATQPLARELCKTTASHSKKPE